MGSTIVACILIGLCILFSKSKTLALILFLFMWSLWGWNTWNGDYDAYSKQFDLSFYSISSNYEIGYYFFNRMLKINGYAFQNFLQIVSFFVLFIVYIFVSRYCKYPALFSAFYFFIFIMEYVFIRNYLSHALLFLAFIFVLENVKYYKLYFVILIIFSISLHATAFLLLPIVFILRGDRILDLRKCFIYLGLALIFSIFFFGPIILPYLGSDLLYKFDFYQTGGGITNVFFAHLLIVLIVWYFFSSLLKTNPNISESERRIMRIVINFNLISLFYLCLYYHIPYFSRILRFIFSFDLVFLLSAFSYIKFYKFKYRLMLCSIIFAIGLMFAKSTLAYTLYPLFLKNEIWGDELYIPHIDNEK